MLSYKPIAPIIAGFDGTRLDEQTRTAFEKLRPAGFILFKRNCESREQLEVLCQELRALSPLKQPLIFIDQEGGRVNRIQWDPYIGPAAKDIGELFEKSPAEGLRAAELNGYIIASQLATYGITVDCLPVADVPVAGAHDIIGDRAFSYEPKTVGALCAATIKGLMAAGVYPVLKHLPGHGRAFADSHVELPTVDTSYDGLAKTDFVPIQTNKDAAFIMTAHVKYTQLDSDNCATFSKHILDNVLREDLGVSGLIVSDDLYMEALEGSLQERANKSLEAGCDLLICGSSRIDGRFDKDRFEQMCALDVEALTPQALEKLNSLPTLPQPQPEILLEAVEEIRTLLPTLKV